MEGRFKNLKFLGSRNVRNSCLHSLIVINGVDFVVAILKAIVYIYVCKPEQKSPV